MHENILLHQSCSSSTATWPSVTDLQDSLPQGILLVQMVCLAVSLNGDTATIDGDIVDNVIMQMLKNVVKIETDSMWGFQMSTYDLQYINMKLMPRAVSLWHPLCMNAASLILWGWQPL